VGSIESPNHLNEKWLDGWTLSKPLGFADLRLRILSLALRLQSEGHAALSAKRQDDSRNEDAGSGETRGVAFCCSSYGECVHAGLRRGRRRPCSASAASTYPTYQRVGDAGERGGNSWKYAGVCGHGNQYN
jgi:hypothetical protein